MKIKNLLSITLGIVMTTAFFSCVKNDTVEEVVIESNHSYVDQKDSLLCSVVWYEYHLQQDGTKAYYSVNWRFDDTAETYALIDNLSNGTAHAGMWEWMYSKNYIKFTEYNGQTFLNNDIYKVTKLSIDELELTNPKYINDVHRFDAL